MWDPMSAQHSKSGSALREMDRGPLHHPHAVACWIPELPKILEEETAYVWSHTCGRTHVHSQMLTCAGPCIHASFLSLFPPAPCPWFRRASSVQRALTTSLSRWSGASRRRRPAGGHTWCTAGKSSSRSGQSLTGTFTMKVGCGQGLKLCFCLYL